MGKSILQLRRFVGLSVLSVLLAVFAMSMAFSVTFVSPAVAQSKSVKWQRLDVDITFQPNGDLRITETNVIQFIGGPFTFGFRDFHRVPYFEITDIVATEANANHKPLGLQTGLINSGDYRVQYFFATPAQDETRTFTLSYTAKGAVNYVDAGDEIFWTGVFAERNGIPVEQSRIRVTMPEAQPALRVEASGVQATTTGENESIVIAEAQEPIPSGAEFKLRVVFPHGLAPTPTPAPPPTATPIQSSPLAVAAVPTVNYMTTVRAVNAERPVTYTSTKNSNDAGENLTLCLSVVVLIGLFVIGAINGFNNDGSSDDNDSSSSSRRSWTSSSSRSSSSSSSSSSNSSSRSSGSSGSSSSRGGGGGGFG